jgi:hypothetical protein
MKYIFILLVTLAYLALITGCGQSAQEQYYKNKLAEEAAQEATESAERTAEVCGKTIATIQAQSNVYAADHDGRYPTSWDDLSPYLEYYDDQPTCPLDGAQYIIEWHNDRPPSVGCPNHGESH